MLAFPPFDLWPLAFLIPVPLVWVAMHAASTRRAVLITIFFQFLMWLWLDRWVIPVTAAGYPLLALYMALYAGVFVWITRRVSRQKTLGRLPFTLLVPTIWVGVECLRGELVFDGYPWYLLAHPLIAWTIFAQPADLFGAYFISFIVAMGGGVIVDATAGRILGFQDRRKSVIPSLVAAAISFLADIGYGWWRMDQRDPLSRVPTILAIQTNLPQDNKTGWSVEAQARDVPAFLDLTRRAFIESCTHADLIVWPETMVPGLGFEPSTIEHLRQFPDFQPLTTWPEEVQSLSRELATPMLVGSNAWVETSLVPGDDGTVRLERRFEYNSAFLIQGEPPYQRYDKFFLTPFGETMPYISNWPWLEEKLLALGARGMSFTLDRNPDIRLLQLDLDGETIHLATPICFEDTVSGVCRRMAYDQGVKRADVFINLSNDGWFGRSDADRRLHAQIARFRCIENRMPMVRCVNTGLSVAIDSAGRLIGAVRSDGYGVAGHPGWVCVNVELDGRSTLFGRIGNVWAWLCLVMCAMLLAWSIVSKSKGVST